MAVELIKPGDNELTWWTKFQRAVEQSYWMSSPPSYRFIGKHDPPLIRVNHEITLTPGTTPAYACLGNGAPNYFQITIPYSEVIFPDNSSRYYVCLAATLAIQTATAPTGGGWTLWVFRSGTSLPEYSYFADMQTVIWDMRDNASLAAIVANYDSNYIPIGGAAPYTFFQPCIGAMPFQVQLGDGKFYCAVSVSSGYQFISGYRANLSFIGYVE